MFICVNRISNIEYEKQSGTVKMVLSELFEGSLLKSYFNILLL